MVILQYIQSSHPTLRDGVARADTGLERDAKRHEDIHETRPDGVGLHFFIGAVAVVFRIAKAGAEAHVRGAFAANLLACAKPFRQLVTRSVGQFVMLDYIGARLLVEKFVLVLRATTPARTQRSRSMREPPATISVATLWVPGISIRSTRNGGTDLAGPYVRVRKIIWCRPRRASGTSSAPAVGATGACDGR